MNEVVWSCEPAYMPLFYLLLNLGGIKQMYPVSEGYLRKNTGFEDSQMSLAAKASRDFSLSFQPVFFANNPH